MIETTGRTYAKPWTLDDLWICYGRQRFRLPFLIMLEGDKRDADLMLALTAEAPSPTVPAPTEGSPAPER
jgi:hypothetical protein